jgi:hypothetical protein
MQLFRRESIQLERMKSVGSLPAIFCMLLGKHEKKLINTTPTADADDKKHDAIDNEHHGRQQR